jgi:hypothetical protein
MGNTRWKPKTRQSDAQHHKDARQKDDSEKRRQSRNEELNLEKRRLAQRIAAKTKKTTGPA